MLNRACVQVYVWVVQRVLVCSTVRVTTCRINRKRNVEKWTKMIINDDSSSAMCKFKYRTVKKFKNIWIFDETVWLYVSDSHSWTSERWIKNGECTHDDRRWGMWCGWWVYDVSNQNNIWMLSMWCAGSETNVVCRHVDEVSVCTTEQRESTRKIRKRECLHDN